MNEKIKECPFCGRANAKQVGDGRHSWVECQCGAKGPRAGSNDEAAGSVERWNTRKTEYDEQNPWL